MKNKKGDGGVGEVNLVWNIMSLYSIFAVQFFFLNYVNNIY